MDSSGSLRGGAAQHQRLAHLRRLLPLYRSSLTDVLDVAKWLISGGVRWANICSVFSLRPRLLQET